MVIAGLRLTSGVSTPLWAAASVSELVPIYTIQGNGAASPLAQQWVDVAGVVTGVTETGFYLQDPVGDNDPATSDGIFVYMHARPTVQVGTCVRVQRGYVDEFYEKTELSRIKALLPADVCATTIITPVAIPATRLNTPPADLFERYEGMLVQVENLHGFVQAPTERFSNGNVEIALLPARLAPYVTGARVFQANAADTTALTFLSGALGAMLPDVTWGDRVAVGEVVNGRPIATGVLDYNFGQYQLVLLPQQPLVVEAGGLQPEQGVASAADDFTVCTFNLYGLGRGAEQFPDEHEYQAQLHKRALAISENLQGCTIIGVEETGTPEDARNLATELYTVFNLDYTATALAGPQTSNPTFPLTVGLLTRTDRVKVLQAAVRQGCSSQDYQVNEQRGVCPAGEFALFDRTPLVADLAVTGDWGEPYRLRVIVNHWKSKGGDETVNAVRREKQARHVATLVQEQLGVDAAAHVVVLGDLNDYYDSVPVAALRTGTQPPLVQPYDFLPAADRYTYIFNGASQVLDHILITANMTPTLASIDPVHIDANFPVLATVNSADAERASDHDPVQMRIRPAGIGMLGGNLRYPGLGVQLVDGVQKPVGEVQSDALGDFRFWHVTPGAYTLHVQAPAYLWPTTTAATLTLSSGYQALAAMDVHHRTIDIAAATALLSAQLSVAAQSR